MKVTVIIPSFNHAKYLKQRIDSVLNQTFKDFELIILDDASTDKSKEIISTYLINNPEIRVYFNNKNSGSPYKQWNKGVSLANGEYIWIAESDDYADFRFLEKELFEIEKSNRIGIVYCDTRIQNDDRGIKYLYSAKNSSKNDCVKFLTEADLVENPIPNVSSVLFRKSAYVGSGMADPGLRFCSDWYLYLKIKQTWDIIYLPEALNTYRLHEDSGYNLHYRSNKFLKEKIQIYAWLLRGMSLNARIFYRILKGITKSLGLRMMHMLHLPSFIIPEIPRIPRKLSHCHELCLLLCLILPS
ncbi:MAG TPA: glycosyltransferase [Bacteroidales bacterium]|nr:glycosyltransferase [Bacteroidales bacterium]